MNSETPGLGCAPLLPGRRNTKPRGNYVSPCSETLKTVSSVVAVDLRHPSLLYHGCRMARDGVCPPDRGLRIRLRSASMSWGALGEGVGEGRSAVVRKASLRFQRSPNVGPYGG